MACQHTSSPTSVQSLSRLMIGLKYLFVRLLKYRMPTCRHAITSACLDSRDAAMGWPLGARARREQGGRPGARGGGGAEALD